jgi:hypothetical protein
MNQKTSMVKLVHFFYAHNVLGTYIVSSCAKMIGFFNLFNLLPPLITRLFAFFWPKKKQIILKILVVQVDLFDQKNDVNSVHVKAKTNIT